MAFSFEVYPNLTGVVTDFAVPFGFINRSHVTADVDGVSAPFTWLSDSMIRMTTAPTGNLTIARSTPKTTQVVTFTDGSTQSAELHNLQNAQLLYVTQEAYDTIVNVLGGDGVQWDALGRQIKNLATPTDPTDVANKAYVDTLQAAALYVVTAARNAAVTDINTEESNALAVIAAAEVDALVAIAADVAAADASSVSAADSAAAALASANSAALDAATATTKAAEAVVSADAAADSAAAAAGYVPTIATKAEAEAGTNNTKLMTPLRTSEAVSVAMLSFAAPISVATVVTGSSVAFLDFALPSPANDFLLRVKDLIPVLNGSGLYARFSRDGGLTYDAGASDYRNGASNLTFIQLTGGISSDPTGYADLDITLNGMKSVTRRKGARSVWGGIDGSNNSAGGTYTGYRSSVSDPITHIRLLMVNGGTFTNIARGRFALYAIR